MGCFGGGKAPEYKAPAAPKLPTAEELYNQGVAKAQEISPLALAAREGALSDLALGPAYYEQFQPTSIEEALSNQYFQNVVPDLEKSIKHSLSLSGMAYSPVLAKTIADARGRVGYDIGTYLSNLGNQRAQYSLGTRLSIDPFSMITPYVNTGMQQSAQQAGLDYQAAQQQAMADYQNAMNEYNSGLGGADIGTLIGMGGALLAAPFTGGLSMATIPAMMTAGSVGGAVGSLFDNKASPISLGDAMSVYQMMSPSTTGYARAGFNGYGTNTPQGVFNTGSMSVFPQSIGNSFIDPRTYGGSINPYAMY